MSLKPEILKQEFAVTQLELPRDLGDGLVLRTATPEDAEPIAQLNGRVFGREHFDELVAAYTRHYVSPTHPVIGPANVILVEDTRTRKPVSTMMLISQTWTYAGIPFAFGRPEVVATDAEYRRRGLVREQFQVIHAMSEAKGELVQGITGIPWYYRQFEYEYALDLSGGRIAYLSNVPALKEGESEPYRLRNMTIDDIPFASALYDRDVARSLVACPRPEWLWRYWLDDSPLATAYRTPFQIIETADGRPVGYVDPSREFWGDLSPVGELAIVEGQPWRAVMPSVLRWLKAFAEAEAPKQNKTVKGIFFAFGREHPVYDAIPDMLPGKRIPYGWYIRVPDVPRFLRHIATALESRLAQSPMSGYTGELKISEYRRGFKLIFENGKMTNAEMWQPTVEEGGDCGFPPLVFLQLLFGCKSIMEQREFFADVWAKDEAHALLNALFPKQYSCVCAVG